MTAEFFEPLSSNGILILKGTLNFTTISVAYKEGAQIIKSQSNIESSEIFIDLAAITDANSVILAMLIEWKRLAQAAGKSVSFINLSSNLLKIAKVYDLEIILGVKKTVDNGN